MFRTISMALISCKGNNNIVFFYYEILYFVLRINLILKMNKNRLESICLPTYSINNLQNLQYLQNLQESTATGREVLLPVVGHCLAQMQRCALTLTN